MSRKQKKMVGTVKKVIKPMIPGAPEKAEITVHEAEDLYKEIRIENALVDSEGEKAKLKEGANVDVIVEADSNATQKAS
jgi:hypothetical protein